MNLRQSPSWQNFKKIFLADPYHLDIDRCDFLEETLLKMSLIGEMPKDPSFEWKTETLVMKLAISAEAAKSVVDFYNELDGAFATVDLTEKTASSSSVSVSTDTSDATSSTSIASSHQTRTLQFNINLDVLQKTVVPLIEKYLQKNPKHASDYICQMRYSHNEANAQLVDFFNKYGINLSHTDCMEETLCYIVQRHLNVSNRVLGFFQQSKLLPKELTGITLEYLGIHANEIYNRKLKNEEQKEEASDNNDVEIKTTISRFYSSQNNTYATDISLATSMEGAKLIENYFNKMGKSIAILSTEVKTKSMIESGRFFHNHNNIDSETPMVTLTIQNGIFFHLPFIIDLEEALSLYSRRIIENYRSASDSLTPCTKGKIAALNMIVIDLETTAKFQSIPETASLINSIKTLSQFLRETLEVYLNDAQLAEIKKLSRDVMSKMYLLKSIVVLDEGLDKEFDKHYKKTLLAAKGSLEIADWYISNRGKYLDLPAPVAHVESSSSSAPRPVM